MNHVLKIFLCYKEEDTKFAMRIQKEISEQTNQISISEYSIGILDILNTDMEHQIITNIEESDILLFLISKASHQSEVLEKIVRYALSIKKNMIPISINKCILSGWMLFNLSGTDIIDYENTFQKSKLLNNILLKCGQPVDSDIVSTASGRTKKINRLINIIKGKYPNISYLLQRMSFTNPITNAVLGFIGLDCIMSLLCIPLLIVFFITNDFFIRDGQFYWILVLILICFLVLSIFGLTGLFEMYIKHKRHGFWLLGLSYYPIVSLR